MPFILPFVPLIAAGVGAATVADTVYNQVNAPSAPATPTAPTTPAPQSAATNEAQKGQASQISSDVQAATGGSVGPDYLASVLNTAFQGNPQATGNWQQAINQLFGLGAPGQTGLTPGASGTGSASSTTGTPGNSITDLLSRVAVPGGGGGSGGGGGAPASSVVQSALSQDFRGFA